MLPTLGSGYQLRLCCEACQPVSNVSSHSLRSVSFSISGKSCIEVRVQSFTGYARSINKTGDMVEC